MRCYVEPAAWRADQMELADEEVHHLHTVMRARVGFRVTLFDGRGRSAEAEILQIERHHARLRVLQQHDQPVPAVELVLIQGIPREQKMDLVVQKATELGVTRILPVQTDHAVMRLRADNEAAKRERWQKIALNAAKQCGSDWLPDVAPVQDLAACLSTMPRVDLFLVCSLEADARPLREIIEQARGAQPRSLAVLVGPEGDLSARERAAARNAGARSASLGSSVLRSETAALYVLSVLTYEFRSGPAGRQGGLR